MGRGAGRRRAVVVAGFVAVAALALSACGAGQALEGPINAISSTDVVVETNLQTTSEAAQNTYEEADSFNGFGSPTNSPGTGLTYTPASSTGPALVSYYIAAEGQAIIFAAYNHATEDCLGVIQIGNTIGSPILGESQPGTYDFLAPKIVYTGCDAALFSEDLGRVPNWPVNDPTSSPNWPK